MVMRRDTEGAQTLQHRGRTHLWCRSGLAGWPRRRARADAGAAPCALDGAIAVEHLPYCLARDLEPTRDSADAEIFGIGQTEHLGRRCENSSSSALMAAPWASVCARCNSAIQVVAGTRPARPPRLPASSAVLVRPHTHNIDGAPCHSHRIDISRELAGLGHRRHGPSA